MNNNIASLIIESKYSQFDSIFLQELTVNFPNINSLMDVCLCPKLISFANIYSLLQSLKTEFIIILQNDMFLYDQVDFDMMQYYIETMKQNPRTVSLRLARGGLSQNSPMQFTHELYTFSNDEEYPFCLYYTIWRRDALMEIISFAQDANQANQLCKQNNLHCIFAYNDNDTKRGMYHWENKYFPFMNSGYANDQWNILEYGIEIENLKREYNL